MQNNYTLITLLGKGVYDSTSGYRKTIYRFPTGKEYDTNVFLEALIKSEYRKFNQIFILGTTTSSWDMLIEKQEEETDFWVELKNACDNDGISENLLQRLEKKLTDWYHVPFYLKAHTPYIDDDTTQELFATYMDTISKIDTNTNVLLDVTHGFRSMPLLVYQTLQFGVIEKRISKIEIMYGEYIPEQKISYVRDLSSYWKYNEIAIARQLFVQKLDGRVMAGILSPYWKEGSEWLDEFSNIVLHNFCLQIPDSIKKLHKILHKNKTKEIDIEWIQDFITELYALDEALYVPQISDCLVQYSNLLEKKKLITQAVITLQVAIETRVVETYGNKTDIGNYQKWVNDYSKKYKNLLTEYKLKEVFSGLEWIRNQIAHGGASSKKNEMYKKMGNLKPVLKNAKSKIKELFNILDNNKKI